jgi:hypothetical protein
MGWRRRSFLWLLHQCHHSPELISVRRARPNHWKLKPGDLQVAKPYHWTLNCQEQGELTEALHQLGDPPPSWYAVLLLSKWLFGWYSSGLLPSANQCRQR